MRVRLVNRCRLSLCFAVVLALSGVGLLVACGQKGPLYLPEETRQKEKQKKESEGQSFIGTSRVV